MQEQTFKTEELKAELERSLGFPLRSLVRLDGASACNFKAVRASDGLTFAVKCSPFDRQEWFDHLISNLQALKGSKAAPRIFERECPATWCGYNLICQAWIDGVRMFPDKLTDAQFEAMLDDYLAFSAAMQNCTNVRPLPPSVEAFDLLKTQLTGFWGRRMLRFLERETPCETLAYAPALVRNIHNDFHHGNFLFVNGQVKGYMDLEEIRKGYPAEDIVRYLVCADEHFNWYELSRTRRILHLFSLAVRHLPYSYEEWLSAINIRFFVKIVGKLEDHRPNPFMLINLKFKSVLYHQMKQRLAHEFGQD